MFEIKSILAPLDLADRNKRIAPIILEMAQKHQAKVYVLFVARRFEPPITNYIPDMDLATLNHQLETEALSQLQEYLDENLPQLKDAEAHVILGSPAHDILAFAKDKNVDLILMGTHGRKGFNRAFFGSVAEKVVKNATMPVMAVNTFRGEKA